LLKKKKVPIKKKIDKFFDDSKSISWNWGITNLEDSQKLFFSYSHNGTSVIQKESLTG